MSTSVEKKVDILFQRVDEIRDLAYKAHTLASYAAQGNVEVRAEVRSLRTIQENILKSQKHIDDEIKDLHKKLNANLKWMIGIIITMILGFAGVIFTMTKVFTQILQALR